MNGKRKRNDNGTLGSYMTNLLTIKKFRTELFDFLRSKGRLIETNDKDSAREFLKSKMTNEKFLDKDNFLWAIRYSASSPDGAFIIIHFSLSADPHFREHRHFANFTNTEINETKVEIKKDDNGVYIEMIDLYTNKSSRYYSVQEYFDHMNYSFYKNLYNGFILRQEKDWLLISTGQENDELALAKQTKLIFKGYEDDFAKQIFRSLPKFTRKQLKCLLLCRGRNTDISQLPHDIFNYILNLIAYDVVETKFFTESDLILSTQQLFKESILSKRIQYYPEIKRDKAQDVAAKEKIIIIRESSIIERPFVLTQPSKCNTLINRIIMIEKVNDSFIYVMHVSISDSSYQRHYFDSPNELIMFINERVNLLPCIICGEFDPHVGKELHCEQLHDSWCTDCILDYFHMKANENDFNIKCHCCDQNIPLENVEKFLQDFSDHKKKEIFLSRISLEIYISQLKKFGYEFFSCPIRDCQGTFVINKEALNETSFLECSFCNKKVCLHCKEEFHTNFTCAQRQEWLKLNNEETKRTNEWKEKNVKACPNCKIEIEKAFGCDHLVCANCKYEFCFICGDKYTEGHLRDHWIRNDPQAINGLFTQHLQLAQMGLINPVNQIPSVTQNNTAIISFKVPIKSTHTLKSQKPFILYEEKDKIFVLNPVLSYMERKRDLLAKQVQDMELEMGETPVPDEVEPSSVDTFSVMQSNFA